MTADMLMIVKGIAENEMVYTEVRNAIEDGELLRIKYTGKKAYRIINQRLWREWERKYG